MVIFLCNLCIFVRLQNFGDQLFIYPKQYYNELYYKVAPLYKHRHIKCMTRTWTMNTRKHRLTATSGNTKWQSIYHKNSQAIMHVTWVNSLSHLKHSASKKRFRTWNIQLAKRNSTSMDHAMQKHIFRHMLTAKALISLVICAFWAGPSLSANRIIGFWMYEWRAKAQILLCTCAGWSEPAHVQRHFLLDMTHLPMSKKTSIARKPMACLPWLIKTHFWVPSKFFRLLRKQIFREIFLFHHEIVCCVYSLE